MTESHLTEALTQAWSSGQWNSQSSVEINEINELYLIAFQVINYIKRTNSFHNWRSSLQFHPREGIIFVVVRM